MVSKPSNVHSPASAFSVKPGAVRAPGVASSGVRAVLLAGGYGTRMQPLSLRTPKVLLPIAGKPGIRHLLERLEEAGVTDVIISLNTRQKRVEEYLGKSFGALTLRYCYEQSNGDADKRGALGAIAHVTKTYGTPEECLIIGSDNFLVGMDLNAFRQFHRSHRADATLALYELANRSDVEHYGITVIDSDSRISRFQEKPKVEEALSQLASTAVYCVTARFLDEHLPAYIASQEKTGKKADRLGDVWHHYVKDLRLFGFTFGGVWGDTNNAQTYIETNKLAMNSLTLSSSDLPHGGTAPSRSHPKVAGSSIRIGKRAKLSADAVIIGPVVIEDDAVIGKCTVGPYAHVMHGATIEDGAVVTGSIVFEHALVKADARVEDSILDGYASVGERARIEPYSILGYKSTVGADARVFSRSKLWPGVKLSSGAVLEGEITTPLTPELQRELDESRFWR